MSELGHYIRELATTVAEATGFRGEIHWDASKRMVPRRNSWTLVV